MAMGTLIFAVMAGILLSHVGRYRPLHAISLALQALAFGLLTRLDVETRKVEWVWYALIASIGSGLSLFILLPAIMADLPEADVAVANFSYSFIRTFGWTKSSAVELLLSPQYTVRMTGHYCYRVILATISPGAC
jgi:hypothetical protein